MTLSPAASGAPRSAGTSISQHLAVDETVILLHPLCL